MGLDDMKYNEILASLKSSKEGRKYPGITKVLKGTMSEESKKALANWRNRIGEQEAQKIFTDAQRMGTSLDKMVMRSFEEGFNENDYVNERCYFLYKQLKRHLKDVQCISTQTRVWSHNLKIQGYLDLFCYYKGELAIIDIKNSKRTKRVDFCLDYMLQCTSYAMMLYELTGIQVKRVGIMMGVRSSNDPQIIIESPSNYIRKVIQRSKQYHGNL